MKTLIVNVFLLFFAILVGCDNSTEPIKLAEGKPFMTMDIGDLRQYYSERENLYLQWEILDTTYRADNLKIYVFDYSIFLPSGVLKSMGYHFIRDGYFWETSKDSVADSSIIEVNPFMESKIIKIYPYDGDYFLRTRGVDDSIKVYHKINLIDSLETPLQVFNNVEECEAIDSDTVQNIWFYYAEVYGHIGTYISNQNGLAEIYVTYLKVGNNEIGKYISFTSNNVIRLPNGYLNKWHNVNN